MKLTPEEYTTAKSYAQRLPTYNLTPKPKSNNKKLITYLIIGLFTGVLITGFISYKIIDGVAQESYIIGVTETINYTISTGNLLSIQNGSITPVPIISQCEYLKSVGVIE